MMILAFVLYLSSGPTWPAYPDITDCRKALAIYKDDPKAQCVSQKIYVIEPSIKPPEKK